MSEALAQTAVLHRIARRLQRQAARRLGSGAFALPALLLVTDPGRMVDPVAAAQRLPPGSGIIFRAFGARDAMKTGRTLAAVARARGLVLLVGADPALARRIGAHGVHLPERLAHRAPAIRAAWPNAIVTIAAHSGAAARRARRLGAHAALLSPAFRSSSPSAGRPLSRAAFALAARGARLPVYALGGVDMKNAPELLGSGAAGIAAVSALGD